MVRCTGVILLLVVGLFALGVPQAIHESQHEWERQQARMQRAAGGGAGGESAPAGAPSPATPAYDDDEGDCPLCLQFHAPYTDTAAPVFRFDAGFWVSLSAMPPVAQYDQSVPARISCRGPPVAC